MPLTLLHAPRSPFALKVRACLVEMRATDLVELVSVDPWTDDSLRALNPLCKVPTLVLEDGTSLFGSAVIVAYLNDRLGAAIVPAGPARWDALRREALGDGLADAVIRRFVERLGPASDRSDRVARRQETAIAAVLDQLEGNPGWTARPVDVGHIAIGVAINHLDARSPELAWRDGRPALAAWFDGFMMRPSMLAARLARPPG